jgi:tetratricopeptide (TPR) repeat protein
MSVLCEGISVIVRIDVLEALYPGGAAGYEAARPNASFCRDDDLTRVGFMHPDDVQAFINELEAVARLAPLDGDQFADLAVVDQFDGLTLPCPWLEWDVADGLTRAWLKGSDPGLLATPVGWTGPSTVKWDLDEGGNVRARVPEGVDFDPADPTGFITTRPHMAPSMATELHRVARPEPQASPVSAQHEESYAERLRDRRRRRDAMGALQVCTQWTEAEPGSAEAWNELGVVATSIHRKDIAEDAWRRAVRLQPDNEKALANLGGAIFDQGRPREAREWLERALALDARDPVALLLLGKSLVTSGDRDEARSRLTEALREARVRRMQGVAIDAGIALDNLRRTWVAHEGKRGKDHEESIHPGALGPAPADEPQGRPREQPDQPLSKPTPTTSAGSPGAGHDQGSPGSSGKVIQSRRRWAGAIVGLLVLGWVLNAVLGSGPDRAAVQEEMRSALDSNLTERHYPLLLTQAEFQEGSRGLWWVTQFVDPAQTPAVGQASTEALVFEYPLEALVIAVRANRSELRELGVSTFIIAFRGDSTVYEIPGDLMWSYADGTISWREVRDRMLITA